MAEQSRVALAFVLGLVGGVLILVQASFFAPFFFGPSPSFFPFGSFGLVLGVVSGAFVIFAAAMTFRNPTQGVTWGVVMIVFGALSVASMGGFLVGMALAITGGALAVVAGAPPGGEPTLRACTACGRLIPAEFAHCPHCGHGTAPPSP
jgi:hypothetical protein